MKCKITILLAAFLALAACSEEQLKPRDYTVPVGDKIALTLKATLADGSALLWDQSAKIGIFSSGGAVNIPCSISASTAGTEEGMFYCSSLTWKDAGDELYVYYPYSEGNDTPVLSGRIPQSYSNQTLSSLNKSNTFYAKVANPLSAKAGALAIDMSPVFSVSSLTLTSDTWSGWFLDRVSIKSKSGEVLSGSFTYDIVNDSFSMVSDMSDSISVNLSGEILSAAGSTVYWLSHGPAAINADMEALLSKEGETSKLLRGSVALTGETTSGVDAFTSEVWEDFAFDLSKPNGGASETANCYIASQCGVKYKFPATVMGNGSAGAAAIAPQSAKVLWQTGAGLIENLRLKDGYVFFSIAGNPGEKVTPGNAVIAVYSEGNAQGRILWSWHIWITDEDLASKLQTWKTHADTPSEFANPQLMDRNLGALSASDWASSSTNASKGFNYQWGRKDPFVGPDNSSMTSRVMLTTYDAYGSVIPAMASASAFSNNARWTHVDQKLTPADIAAYPMAFVSGASNYIWLDGATDGLWSTSKTIYDPCPPGYRVMSQYAMSGVTSALAGGKLANLEHHILNVDTYRANGEDLQVLYDGVSAIALLPATGLVYFEKAESFFPFDRVGTYGYIWSCSISAAGSNKAFRMHYDWNNFASREQSYGSYGHNVRCEKIK
ncbi:MAG: hypothetical protein IJS07_01030 [Bacteroidales bacterium]|nr:hypothetical protein [Bacteroidales bacterium]